MILMLLSMMSYFCLLLTYRIGPYFCILILHSMAISMQAFLPVSSSVTALRICIHTISLTVTKPQLSFSQIHNLLYTWINASGDRGLHSIGANLGENTFKLKLFKYKKFLYGFKY